MHVTLRLIVREPLPGVALAVQRGRAELVQPTVVTAAAQQFDLALLVGTDRTGAPALRGPEVQGPAGARFLYVSAGRSAGQFESAWQRRAKVPLGGITPGLLAAALAAPNAVIEGAIAGTAKDGGPSCATVPLLGAGWRVV